MAGSLFGRKQIIPMKNILTLDQLPNLIKKLKLQSKSIVLVGGCFDILHIGHITFLEKAKKEGDILLVMLESDKSIQERKGITRPIHTRSERAHILSQLRLVDFIVLLPHMTSDKAYEKVVKMIQPAIIAVTKGDNGISKKRQQAKKFGATLKIVTNHIANDSTTHLLELLQKEL